MSQKMEMENAMNDTVLPAQKIQATANDIKVSVLVITYKHAKYIERCLDSVLAQKVNFRYEIVVGEDCSNDGTREILLKYKERYPDIFVLLLNEENMGVSGNGFNVRAHSRGEYLTGLEGDDFWINDTKLQQQVDFLDAHPEYGAVGTNSVNVDHEGKNPRITLMNWQVNRTYTLRDYLRGGMVIHGNSLMRRRYHPEDEERYTRLRLAEPTMGDIITRVIIYDMGKLYVLPSVTHAHRDGAKDPTSYTAAQKDKAVEMSKMYMRIVDNLTEYFDGKYDLQALKAQRMGVVLYNRLSGRNRMDMKQYWALLNTLPVRLRVMSLFRCLRVYFRLALRLAGKKLGMFKKVTEI